MTAFGFEVVLACAVGLLAGWLWPGEERRGLRLWILIGVSAAVLAFWEPSGLLVTMTLVAATWAALRLGARPTSRRVGLVGGTFVLLGTLIFYRYSGSREAPLGLSFTVFRLIGVLLDAVNLRQSVAGGELLLLALFFPTYRSGPITTFQSFGPLPVTPLAERVGPAVNRIFLGLCRKLLLATNLSTLALTPWLRGGLAKLSPEQFVLLPVLLGLRIYWDFAGYTDIAVGTAALLGYRVPENFERPYLSRNIVEFWRRWHITLSEWIRLRLFMKMTGRRSGKVRIYAAIIVSMALCGLWHGVGWNFLLWGVWHGAGMVAVHLFGDAQRRSEVVRRIAALPGSEAVATALTFAYVSLGWLLFFFPLHQAWVGARGMGAALGTPVGWATLCGAVVIGAVVYALGRSTTTWAERWRKVPGFARGLIYGLLAWAMVVSAQPEPFIYFRF